MRFVSDADTQLRLDTRHCLPAGDPHSIPVGGCVGRKPASRSESHACAIEISNLIEQHVTEADHDLPQEDREGKKIKEKSPTLNASSAAAYNNGSAAHSQPALDMQPQEGGYGEILTHFSKMLTRA